MGLKNVHTRLTGHPMELGVSTEMLGRTMNGIGERLTDWVRSCRKRCWM